MKKIVSPEKAKTWMERSKNEPKPVESSLIVVPRAWWRDRRGVLHIEIAKPRK